MLTQFDSYVAEAHIVHWDMKYGSFITATKHNDGLHVLGILIEVFQHFLILLIIFQI